MITLYKMEKKNVRCSMCIGKKSCMKLSLVWVPKKKKKSKRLFMRILKKKRIENKCCRVKSLLICISMYFYELKKLFYIFVGS